MTLYSFESEKSRFILLHSSLIIFAYTHHNSAEIDPKLFIKKKKGDDKDQKKKIGEIEAQIYRLIEILGEQREMTRDNVERKQARTEDERIEDEDDEFIEEAEEGKFEKMF